MAARDAARDNARGGDGDTSSLWGRTTSGFRWLTRTPRGLLTLASAVAGSALLGVLIWNQYRAAPLLDSPDAWAWFALASLALWLPLSLLLLDKDETLAEGPRLNLPLTSLAILAGLAAIAAANQTYQWGLFGAETGQAGWPPMTPALGAFFGFLALAFLPRIASAVQFARAQAREKKQAEERTAHRRATGDAAANARAVELEDRAREQGDAEALGAFIATAAVIAIGTLAYFAAGWTDGKGLRNAVGIAISSGVVALFAVVIILDWVAEAPPVRAASRMVRGFSRRMRWLADFYDFIDTLLVRIGAHVAGMEHRNVASRYVILGGSILFLSIIAWHLPAPYGLIPAVIGFVVALSVSRLWSWVEDDRNLAAITSFDPNTPKKVGFREDYRDETLLGFIFVLVLIPIAMAQADAAQVFGAHLFDGGGDKGTLGPWLGYFGFELAKALPVVDWADIYNLQPGDDQLKPNGAIGMHAIFVARVTVDLVLIAALLQAISIATRNRQQKTLYAAGRIDRLDELVEKRELSKVLALPRNQRLTAKNVVDFRAYNRDRLKELYTTAKDNVLKAFIKELFDDLNDTLDPAIKVLDRLSATSRDEGQMHRTLDEAIAENGAGPYETPIGDLMQVMENLRKRPGLQSLKFEIMDFAMTLGSAQERAEFLESILVTAKDDFKYATLRAGVLLTRLVPKLNEHSFMVQLFEDIEGKRTEIFGANDRVPDELLDALRRRLTELRPTVSDERPEQKPGQEPEPVLRESESEAASTAPHTDQPESAPEPEKV